MVATALHFVVSQKSARGPTLQQRAAWTESVPRTAFVEAKLAPVHPEQDDTLIKLSRQNTPPRFALVLHFRALARAFVGWLILRVARLAANAAAARGGRGGRCAGRQRRVCRADLPSPNAALTSLLLPTGSGFFQNLCASSQRDGF